MSGYILLRVSAGEDTHVCCWAYFNLGFIGDVQVGARELTWRDYPDHHGPVVSNSGKRSTPMMLSRGAFAESYICCSTVLSPG
jgi:hypothetical protein